MQNKSSLSSEPHNLQGENDGPKPANHERLFLYEMGAEATQRVGEGAMGQSFWAKSDEFLDQRS